MRDALILLLAGAGLMFIWMSVLWLVQRRTGNAGVVDVGWAAGLGTLAVLYALLGPGLEARRWLVALMGGLWGLRLAAHIHLRSHGKPEDGRYQELRRQWAPHVQVRMFRFYQYQALAAMFFSAPFLLSAINWRPGLTWNEYAAAALWMVALVGESIADAQLNRHKADPANRGKTCRSGLWRYSRHPNYFFEWLIWCAFALLAWQAPFGSLTMVCPALMLYFLFRVTGIPATEAQALRTRGDDYRDYQRTTSAFVPWFPKRSA